jgi:hypothetical protein
MSEVLEVQCLCLLNAMKFGNVFFFFFLVFNVFFIHGVWALVIKCIQKQKYITNNLDLIVLIIIF